MLNIQFILNREDYLHYQLYSVYHSEKIKKQRRFSRMTGPVMGGIAFLYFAISSGQILPSLIFIATAILYYFIYPFWEKRYYEKHLSTYVDKHYSKAFNDTTSYELATNYLHGKSTHGESTVYLNQVEQISETDRYYFVKLKAGGTIIFPKTAIDKLPELTSWVRSKCEEYNLPLLNHNEWKWQ